MTVPFQNMGKVHAAQHTAADFSIDNKYSNNVKLLAIMTYIAASGATQPSSSNLV